MFDAVRYDREILRPLRGVHGSLPPGDLMARYAVEPGMDSRQVVERLAEIRAWWRERTGIPDSRAEVCRLFLLDDERLVAETGDMMNDPAWWLEQATGAVPQQQAAEAARDTAPAGTRTAERSAARDRPPGWRTAARAKFWSAVAALDREPVAAAREPHRPVPLPAPRSPEPPAGPALAIGVRAVRADGDRCVVEASWSAALLGDVRVHCAGTVPRFVAGDEIAPGAARDWGTRVGATPVVRGDRQVVEDTVPTGYLVYVPFLFRDGVAVVGRQVALNTAGPVQHLRVERRGDTAVVSWSWPADSVTALVEWTADGAEPERRDITLAEYGAEHGCVFRGARAGGTATVRALCTVGATVARSPPRSATLAAAPPTVRYSLARGRRLLGRQADFTLTLTADSECADLVVTVVVATGRTMPTSVGGHTVVARFGPLTVGPRAGPRLSFGVPRPPARPYWIKCFAGAPYPIALEDPPIAQMRVE